MVGPKWMLNLCFNYLVHLKIASHKNYLDLTEI